MSEETKKAPEAGTPAPEQETQQPAGEQQQAAPEAAAAAPEDTASEAGGSKEEPKKKDGWFNKKNRDAEALKAKAEAAEKAAAQAKDQLLRVAAEYDNYRKRSTREADQKFNDGISYAVNQIIPILEVLGKPFDPNLMNAVQQVPAQEGQESGTVVTVYQKGYKLGDKIVRHATVVVAE